MSEAAAAHAQLSTLRVGCSADAWRSVSFDDSAGLRIGSTLVEPGGEGSGVLSATVNGVASLDGLALDPAPDAAIVPDAPSAGVTHPNGVVAIDHVVVMTPAPDRTTAAFVEEGLEPRRVRAFDTADGRRRQTFFWMGDVICEVVGPDDGHGNGPASWWGLALTVHDLDQTVAMLGDKVSEPRTAVQPGRRVATIRRSAGLTVPILLISPHPGSTS